MPSSFDRLATRRHGDWRALLRTGANCLVTAPTALLEEFDSASQDVLRDPIARVCGTRPLDLTPTRTLIVANIHLLGATHQRALMTWMDAPAQVETQVVTLAPVSLFAMVEAGAFEADLFYRLNAIHLDLGAVDPAH